MKKTKKRLLTPDKSTLYYEVSGSGFPLFLLHGNGGSGKYFAKQVPAFSKFFTVYTIDSRGHGHSTNTSDQLTFAQMSDDLHLIMSHENIKQANLLGFSDGANLAMVFAKKYPEFVHKLVLNAGNTIVRGVYWPIQLVTWITYGCLKFCALFSKKAKKRLPVFHLMLTDIGVTTADLQQIKAQTLVIVGKYDVIRRTHSLYLAREIPHASFVLVPKQGHSFAETAPAVFNKEILTFLNEKKVYE